MSTSGHAPGATGQPGAGGGVIAVQSMLDLDLEPTPAMLRGQQRVFACSQCGTVVVQSGLVPGPLGACPSCAGTAWRHQELPVAGLRNRGGGE